MKTIQQRLQSRISKRRNLIREVETGVAVLKTQRHVVRKFDLGDYGDAVILDLSDTLYEARQFIKQLADDQKLDKRIKQVIGEWNATRRFYELPELS